MDIYMYAQAQQPCVFLSIKLFASYSHGAVPVRLLQVAPYLVGARGGPNELPVLGNFYGGIKQDTALLWEPDRAKHAPNQSVRAPSRRHNNRPLVRLILFVPGRLALKSVV